MMVDDDTGTYRDSLNDFQPGAFLGTRYKILKMIGAGGMGRVYMTHDLELDLDVALKIIRPELLQSEKALERLKNELILARKVSHKNVVRIHDIGEVGGVKYLTMTYIAGKSLREVLRESGALNVTRAVSIFIQICEGVAAAHDEGVVHRDLKPANVMLDETDRVYLTDFGIAKWLEAPDDTATGVLIGTPAYLSPEQTWGERPDARSDIYALGLILCELLTGELPFDQQKAAAFKSRLPSNLSQKLKKAQPETPRYLISIAQKCLEPDRSKRYQTVQEILNDLQSKSVSSRFIARRFGIWAACLLLIIIISITMSRMYHHNIIPTQAKLTSSNPPAIGRTAVVLPFRNKTGNRDLSWTESTLSDLLIADLSQTSGLRIVSSDRLFQLIKDLKLDPGSYDDESAKKIADILDTGLVVQGSLTQIGSKYRADVQISDRTDANSSFHLQATGNREEDLLVMVDQLSQQIHQKLQTRPEQNGRTSQPMRPTLAALKLYQQGLQKLRQGDNIGSIEAFHQCILIDSKYGEAYLNLARAYSQNGQEDDAIAILRKAIENGITGSDKTQASVQGEYAKMQGDLKTAIEIYKTLSLRHPQDPEVFLWLADAYEANGELNPAIVALRKVVELDPNEAQAYFRLGKDTILAGNADQAISQYLIKALSIQTQLNNRQGQADSLNAMGVAYERLGRYDNALKYYQDALTIKEQIGNKKSATTSLTNIAKIYIFQSQFEKAKTILNRALIDEEQLKDQTGIADIQNTFGVIYENQGQYTEALKYYKKALQIRKELADDRLTAASYDNIGQIYFLMAHYDEAQVFMEQALTLRQKTGDQNGMILSLQSIGSLQLAQGEQDHALKHFLDALDQARSLKFENAIAVSFGNMGTIYQNQGRYDAALSSYNEAIDVLKNLNDKKGQAEYTKLIGVTFLEMGDFQQARKQFERAKEISQEIGSDELLTDTAILTARLDRLTGDPQEAQKRLVTAEALATKDDYKTGLLMANIEKGLLTKSDSVLRSVFEEAVELHDVWLQIESEYALALVYLQTERAAQAVQVCEKAIPMAKRFDAPPYLYRFHSIEGQAYAKISEHPKAKDHFQQAAVYIENIRRELKNDQLSAFLKLPEVEVVPR